MSTRTVLIVGRGHSRSFSALLLVAPLAALLSACGGSTPIPMAQVQPRAVAAVVLLPPDGSVHPQRHADTQHPQHGVPSLSWLGDACQEPGGSLTALLGASRNSGAASRTGAARAGPIPGVVAVQGDGEVRTALLVERWSIRPALPDRARQGRPIRRSPFSRSVRHREAEVPETEPFRCLTGRSGLPGVAGQSAPPAILPGSSVAIRQYRRLVLTPAPSRTLPADRSSCPNLPGNPSLDACGCRRRSCASRARNSGCHDPRARR